MNRDEAVERAAAHAVRLFARANHDLGPDTWDKHYTEARRAWRADIVEVLDASGYPAALAEAIALLRAGHHEPYGGAGGKQFCIGGYCESWPCPTARFLAEHDETET